MKMDEIRRIADELNRGCYSEKVLKYFFASRVLILKTSAVIATTKATVSHWKTSLIYNRLKPKMKMRKNLSVSHQTS